jgi:hypothetical protein
MTLADITNRIYFYTNTDSTSFTAANMLLAINNAQDEVHSAILEAQDGWRIDGGTDFPIALTNLVANQADYSFPSDILKVHSVEVAYDGYFYKAQPLTENQATVSLEEYPFSMANPFYQTLGISLILYPAPTANKTNGLKVIYDRNFTLFTSADLSTGTAVPKFDRNFHDIIPVKCSLDWCIANGISPFLLLKAMLDELYIKLRQHYGNKHKDKKHEFTPLIEDYL